jgi:hypothetical protein
MAKVFFRCSLLDCLKNTNPLLFSFAISLQFKQILYIKNIMKVVREKLIECSILVKELFENTEDALTEKKEGKIISVDILNTKFIRNNIKIADGENENSSSEPKRQAS